MAEDDVSAYLSSQDIASMTHQAEQPNPAQPYLQGAQSIGQSFIDALMAGPRLMGDVMEGRLDPSSPEAIKRSFGAVLPTAGAPMLGAGRALSAVEPAMQSAADFNAYRQMGRPALANENFPQVFDLGKKWNEQPSEIREMLFGSAKADPLDVVGFSKSRPFKSGGEWYVEDGRTGGYSRVLENTREAAQKYAADRDDLARDWAFHIQASEPAVKKRLWEAGITMKYPEFDAVGRAAPASPPEGMSELAKAIKRFELGIGTRGDAKLIKDSALPGQGTSPSDAVPSNVTSFGAKQAERFKGASDFNAYAEPSDAANMNRSIAQIMGMDSHAERARVLDKLIKSKDFRPSVLDSGGVRFKSLTPSENDIVSRIGYGRAPDVTWEQETNPFTAAKAWEKNLRYWHSLSIPPED